MEFYYNHLNYYVYAYLREDLTSYYIGKGKNNRAFEKHKNVKTPTINHIVILENNLTELGAFAIERRMIKWYGRQFNRTGILENIAEGGPIGLSSDDRESTWKSYLEEEYGEIEGWNIDPYARLAVRNPQP